MLSLASSFVSMCLGENGNTHRKAFWLDSEVIALFTADELVKAVVSFCEVDLMGTYTDQNMLKVQERLEYCDLSESDIKKKMAEIETAAVRRLEVPENEFQFDLVRRASSRLLPTFAATVPVLHGWGLATVGMALAYDGRLLTEFATQRLRKQLEERPVLGALMFRYMAEGFHRYRPDSWEMLLAESGLRLWFRFQGWDIQPLRRNAEGELEVTLRDEFNTPTFIHEGSDLQEGEWVMVSYRQVRDCDAEATVGGSPVYRLSLQSAKPATEDMLANWQDYLR
jgi:hypothetical protein